MAVSCFSRSVSMLSGLDLEGEVSASEDEEDAIRVAMLENPPDATYEDVGFPLNFSTRGPVYWCGVLIRMYSPDYVENPGAW
jgi:hypothetical protein